MLKNILTGPCYKSVCLYYQWHTRYEDSVLFWSCMNNVSLLCQFLAHLFTWVIYTKQKWVFPQSLVGLHSLILQYLWLSVYFKKKAIHHCQVLMFIKASSFFTMFTNKYLLPYEIYILHKDRWRKVMLECAFHILAEWFQGAYSFFLGTQGQLSIMWLYEAYRQSFSSS